MNTSRFNLRRTEDEQFFSEWFEDLPSLTDAEKSYPDKPVFGMVTNGDEIFFVKLSQQGTAEYDISDVFALLPLRNKLYNVLQILKRIGQVISQG